MDYPVYRTLRDIPGTPAYRCAIEKPHPFFLNGDTFVGCVLAVVLALGFIVAIWAAVAT